MGDRTASAGSTMSSAAHAARQRARRPPQDARQQHEERLIRRGRFSHLQSPMARPLTRRSGKRVAADHCFVDRWNRGLNVGHHESRADSGSEALGGDCRHSGRRLPGRDNSEQGAVPCRRERVQKESTAPLSDRPLVERSPQQTASVGRNDGRPDDRQQIASQIQP